mmetsp:Transcript_15272/g.37329  ORF Transcript_15272/g.37329 Transcript_15272/m.37329 type:complete len:224 (-) Transcript_15272:227-898(-)
MIALAVLATTAAAVGARAGAVRCDLVRPGARTIAPRVSMALDSRRSLLQAAALAAVAAPFAVPHCAQAIGPVTVDLEIKKFEEITCPPELAAGRIGGSIGAGASKGIKQSCIKVTAVATNPNKGTIPDAAVFGRVFNAEGNSVVANNPDGRTDAGQMAMIPSLQAGTGETEFVFVATDKKTSDMSDLRFESMKAISYPGGSRYKVYDECEQNPAMDGCGMDDD